MTNPKHKGNVIRRSIRLLECSGYQCTRTDTLGPFDVIALSSQDVLLVQVRIRDWPKPWEADELRAFTSPPNSRKLVHVWHARARLPLVMEV